MKRLIPLVILTFVCFNGFSQNADEALRYAETFASGTARYVSMGGAFGALGADFSATSQNPAGLGFYRKSEFMFSPEFYNDKVKAKYFGHATVDSKFNINTNNLGFVFSFNDKKKESGFIGWSLAMGFNKLNDYHSNSYAEGVNPNTSLADYFADDANNSSVLDPYSNELFYNAYILDQDSIGYFVNDDMDLPGLQRKIINKEGKMNDWMIGAGFNISNMVYFGFSFDWMPVYYYERATHSEYDADYDDYLYFSYFEGKKVSGSGYGAKFGVIVRPVSMFRFGFALHTPVMFDLHQTDEVYVETYYPDEVLTRYYPLDDNDYEIEKTKFDYIVQTPAKFIASAAITLGDQAIVSTDIEYIDYSTMKFSESGDGYDYTSTNLDVSKIFRNTINWKAGVEYRIEPFYIRGGFGYYGSPYVKDDLNEKAYSLMYSGGFGYRNRNFFVDFAISNRTRQESILLPSVDEEAKFTKNTTRFTTTIGFRF